MAKTIYELKRYHHRKAYRKGDLEDETIQDFSQTFSTRKEGNEFLERKQQEESGRYTCRINLVKRGNDSSTLYVYTGNTWIHENTGEEMEEYYSYILKKKIL